MNLNFWNQTLYARVSILAFSADRRNAWNPDLLRMQVSKWETWRFRKEEHRRTDEASIATKDKGHFGDNFDAIDDMSQRNSLWCSWEKDRLAFTTDLSGPFVARKRAIGCFLGFEHSSDNACGCAALHSEIQSDIKNSECNPVINRLETHTKRSA